MDVFISLGILLLATLISTLLMFVPGFFALFFHQLSGKYSRKKADDLSLFYIIGVETITIILLFLISIIICASPLDFINLDNRILLWTLSGILVALGIVFFFFYFRRGKTSALFVSRKTVTKFTKKINTIKTRSDAFMLGLVSATPELFFTLPLYFVSLLVISSISMTSFPCTIFIIIFALLTITPLFIIHYTFNHNCNLATYIRFRIKNKNFFRYFISCLYLLIAILIIIIGGFHS